MNTWLHLLLSALQTTIEALPAGLPQFMMKEKEHHHTTI